MSLSVIALLLQTSVSLLLGVQNNPDLPQSMHDGAIQIAQQAITEATQSIALDRLYGAANIPINETTPTQSQTTPLPSAAGSSSTTINVSLSSKTPTPVFTNSTSTAPMLVTPFTSTRPSLFVPGRDVNATLAFADVSRTYILHIPANYDPSKSYPLMMVFHGNGGTGAETEKETQFNTIADQNGFFVAYPDSVGAKWILTGSNNDVTFNLRVIHAIETKYSIDSTHVYISGYSQGGGMVTQLACGYTGTFAGAATVSENFNPTTESACHPSRPIKFALFHGTADPISPYSGGTNPLSGGTTYSAQDTAQFWATNNGCSAAIQATQIPDTLDTGAAVVDTRQAWTGCTSGARVIFYTIKDGGHTWPGSAADSGQSLDSIPLGAVSQNLNASQLIWQTLGQ